MATKILYRTQIVVVNDNGKETVIGSDERSIDGASLARSLGYSLPQGAAPGTPTPSPPVDPPPAA